MFGRLWNQWTNTTCTGKQTWKALNETHTLHHKWLHVTARQSQGYSFNSVGLFAYNAQGARCTSRRVWCTKNPGQDDWQTHSSLLPCFLSKHLTGVSDASLTGTVTLVFRPTRRCARAARCVQYRLWNGPGSWSFRSAFTKTSWKVKRKKKKKEKKVGRT